MTGLLPGLFFIFRTHCISAGHFGPFSPSCVVCSFRMEMQVLLFQETLLNSLWSYRLCSSAFIFLFGIPITHTPVLFFLLLSASSCSLPLFLPLLFPPSQTLCSQLQPLRLALTITRKTSTSVDVPVTSHQWGILVIPNAVLNSRVWPPFYF